MTTDLATIEREFAFLVDRLDELKRVSAEAARGRLAAVESLKNELLQAQQQLVSVEQSVAEKNEREWIEISKIQGQQVSALVGMEIKVPERQLGVFWDQLRLKVEPASFGGVQVTMGFHQKSKLPNLVFVLRYQDFGYQVADCDPLVIGLADMVDQLNGDNRAGALARFVCRVRARYTAQYSAEWGN